MHFDVHQGCVCALMFTRGVCSFQVYSAEARCQNFGMSMLERLHQYYFNFYHQLQSRPQSTPLNIFLSINYRTKVQSLSVLSTSSSASSTTQRYSQCQYCQHLPQHQLLHQGTVTVSALNIFLSIDYCTKVQSLSVLSTSSSASSTTQRYSQCSQHLSQHQLPHTGTVTVSTLNIFLGTNYRTQVQSLSVFSSSSSASTTARRYSHCQYSQHLPQHHLPHKGTVSALNIFLSIIYHIKVQSVLSTSSSASTITHRYSHCQYSHHLPRHQLPHKGRVTVPSNFLCIIYRTKIQSTQHLP